MHTSVFKVPLGHSLLAVNCLSYLEGYTYGSAILVAVGKSVSLFIPCTVLCCLLIEVTVTRVKVMCVRFI